MKKGEELQIVLMEIKEAKSEIHFVKNELTLFSILFFIMFVASILMVCSVNREYGEDIQKVERRINKVEKAVFF